MTIPRIDPNVKYKGTSYLRELNAETLRALEGAIVIQGTDLEPLAVIVPMETYLAMQAAATMPPLHAGIFDNANPDMKHSTEGYSELDAVGPPAAGGKGKATKARVRELATSHTEQGERGHRLKGPILKPKERPK